MLETFASATFGSTDSEKKICDFECPKRFHNQVYDRDIF